MIATILGRAARTAAQNMLRHAGVHATGIAVISLLSLLMAGIVLLQLTQNQIRAAVNSQLDLVVEFAAEPTDFEVADLQRELTGQFPAIRGAEYISPDAAFSSFLDSFREKTDRDLLADWLARNQEQSPLPAALILAADPALHRPILDWLASSRFASQLELESNSASPAAAAERLAGIDAAITRLTVAASIAVLVLASLIITAVLHLAILARRDEIVIMRLTGATAAFIRLPFVLEAIAVAVLGAGLGLAASFVGIGQLGNLANLGSLGAMLTRGAVEYFEYSPQITGWMLLGAGLIGWASSRVILWRALARDEITLGSSRGE